MILYKMRIFKFLNIFFINFIILNNYFIYCKYKKIKKKLNYFMGCGCTNAK